jgi:hypothetical protein
MKKEKTPPAKKEKADPSAADIATRKLKKVTYLVDDDFDAAGIRTVSRTIWIEDHSEYVVEEVTQTSNQEVEHVEEITIKTGI